MGIKSDIEIAQEAKMLPIADIDAKLGIGEDTLVSADCPDKEDMKILI